MDKIIYRKDVLDKGKEVSLPVKSILNNIFTKIALLLVSSFLLYNVFHSMRIMTQKLEILNRARREVELLRVKNLELAMTLESMSTTEYIEIQARDRLNFAGDNEYVFIISPNALSDAKSKIDSLLDTNSLEEKRRGYLVWVDFFKAGI